MIAIAFAAGFISFLSPCVLPLIPSYLSLIAGLSVKELAEPALAPRARFRVSLHALCFILGFSFVFMAMGASATALGQFMMTHQILFRRIGGIVVLIFGAYLTGVLKVPFLSRERRLALARHPTGFLGSLIIGSVFAIGWSPCVGPILASILVLAGTSDRLSEGLLLLASYSAGLGLPFFLAALATSHFLTAMKAIRKYLVVIERVSGVMLMGIGLLLVSGWFTRFAAYLNQWMGPVVQWLAGLERGIFGGKIP